MEYVEKLTLREAIEDGVSELDSWRWTVSVLFFELIPCSCVDPLWARTVPNPVSHAAFHLAQVSFDVPFAPSLPESVH